MIRIAQILGNMNGGGAEQMVMNYFHAIDRDKIQFDFYIFESSKAVPSQEIKSLGGRIFILPTLKRPAEYVKTLERLLKQGGYTIAHCHLSTLSGPALYAAKRAGVPVRIVHNHSTSGGRREILRNIAKAAFKPAAKMFATERFACSEHAAKWMYGGKAAIYRLPQNTADKKCVRIMPNAVDTKKYSYSDEKRAEIRKELNIPSDAVVFGHIGRMCPQKNQAFLLDIFKAAVRERPNARLILTGTGPDLDMLKAYADREKISNKVIFTGQRFDADKLYSAMDCFVMPSNYEGLPVVGVEAQCSGICCLFSDRITSEAKIIRSARFMSLKSSPGDWARAALDGCGTREENAEDTVARNGYDIGSAAAALQKFYEERLESASRSDG